MTVDKETAKARERIDEQIRRIADMPPPLDWQTLGGQKPPTRRWAIEEWLGIGYTTLMAGPGGIGKTLFLQQMLTWLRLGRPVLGAVSRPYTSLMWACEDDHDELWRRQDRICNAAKAGFDGLKGFWLVPRAGAENCLLSTEFGRPMWNYAVLAELEEQIHAYDPDIIALDNVGQLFGANENSRHDVTYFLNGLIGIANKGRDRSLILSAHPSRAAGSEFAGSGAWENAVRMRWWLGDKLPDEAQSEEAPEDDGTRYLCKRKTNYSSRDYVRMEFDAGAFVWEDPATVEPGEAPSARLKLLAAKRAVLNALERLTAMQVWASEAKGRNYLPALMVHYGLAEGMSSAILSRALADLMVDGAVIKVEVGKYANRNPRMGLKVA